MGRRNGAQGTSEGEGQGQGQRGPEAHEGHGKACSTSPPSQKGRHGFEETGSQGERRSWARGYGSQVDARRRDAIEGCRGEQVHGRSLCRGDRRSLLREPREVGGQDHQGGAGGQQCGAQVDGSRNYVRGPAAGIFGGAGNPSNGSRLPFRLWPRGKWRPLCSWSKRLSSSSRAARGRVDEQLGRRCGSPRGFGEGRDGRAQKTRRRIGCRSTPGASSIPGRPQGRCSGEGGQEGGQEEEKEKEKGEEEEEGREGGVQFQDRQEPAGWTTPCDSLTETLPVPLLRNGVGHEREGPQKGFEESPEDSFKEERPQQELIGVFHVQLQQISESGERGGRPVHGGQQSERSWREVSRSPMPRELESHETGPACRPRRGLGWNQQPPNCYDVLQAGGAKAGIWPHGQGDAEPLGGFGSFDPGQAGTGCGYNRTTPEELRDGPERHSLVSGSKDGVANQRSHQHCSAHRAPSCPQGDLLRVKDQLPSIPGAHCEEAGGKRQRTGRKERQREERREGSSRRQRRRWRLEGERQRRQRSQEEVRSEKREGGARRSSFGSVAAPMVVATSNEVAVQCAAGVEEVEPPPWVASLPESTEGLRGGFPLLDVAGSPRLSGEKKLASLFSGGESLKGLGPTILRNFLEVLVSVPLRSKSMGGRKTLSLFPLPTSKEKLQVICPKLDDKELSWICLILMGLNSIWGDDVFSDDSPSDVQCSCIREMEREVCRWCEIPGTVDPVDWKVFFTHRGVDYQGEEVKVARQFRWNNIAPALPAEVGRVPLCEVCTLGSRHYVENFPLYLKPRGEWVIPSKPRVMVQDSDWPEVCEGLLKSGVCGLMPRESVFEGPNGLLLNGLFGVPKDETTPEGIEVFRLIMNLIPLNGICQSMAGDVATLPSWSGMNPFFLQPGENLLISSEDVRCFFYIMGVPECWFPFLCFNKLVPDGILPSSLKGSEVYLHSRVLPMGFLNSVSLAQHVHRNLAGACNSPEAELRKDRPFTLADPRWRIYLDNYDLLERVEATQMVDMVGSVAAPVLALRGEYELWDIPRNLKKAVNRQPRAEVQGAQVDGVLGVAFPREQKLLKYLAIAGTLAGQQYATQRQFQVACGGLVYISMFRRSLLGCLNAVWGYIESFESTSSKWLPIPSEVKLELLRFVALGPLARLDFRLPMHRLVTCSDASSSGGGVCVSKGLSPLGVMASQGNVRGELAEDRRDHKVLSIGLFDGIGALRVALDLLDMEVLGHISVEVNPAASRVVEANFPSTVMVSRVEDIDADMVQSWAGAFSQASLVILGAGPPCQGVSGLNADRQGALRDARSSLFFHVSRVRGLVSNAFVWAQVHTLMESVASMDDQDLEVMSHDFGSFPWRCEAGMFLWCNRPRYYWISWELIEQEEVVLVAPTSSSPGRLELSGFQHLDDVCREGWTKVDPFKSFPTFTTSRPRGHPGRKPAGIHQCTQEELDRWSSDSFRFPPYQYRSENCLVNRAGVVRLPSPEEKEAAMGFPVGYTSQCVPKSQRSGVSYDDVRHTLIGNSWAVPVVAWLLGQLFSVRGLCRVFTPQQVLDQLLPQNRLFLQDRLVRVPLRPLRGSGGSDGGLLLAQKLGNLVSMKGEDLMISGTSSEQVRFQRLRASVPSKLWKWKVVAGWKWTGNPEHINSLELRAILTTLQWRVCHQRHLRCRFLHLTDSMVCLHALSRGRSSSKKLRRTLCRINALLLVSGSQGLWGYVHTDSNPADKPSRWGRAVKTRFRNG